jgi:GWxTD domain-containing protein
MKRLFFIVIMLSAAAYANAKEVTANLTWSAFSTPDHKTFVETYMSIIGNSVEYKKNKNGSYQASVEVLMTITENDSIKAIRKYILASPETTDSSKTPNFIDLQRFQLPVGMYKLQVTLTDLNHLPARTITNWKSLIVDIDKDSISVSGIQLLENYLPAATPGLLTKSGYDLIPYVSSFYPENLNKITLYAELYNTSKVLKSDEKFVVFCYIENAQTGRKLNDFNTFIKMSPQAVNPVLHNFNIEKLPGGTFNVVVEARSATNRLLSMRKTTIERYNPGVAFNLEDITAMDVSTTFAAKITNKDTLIDVIRCLRPISSEMEKEFAENRIKADDVALMQQYFYNFWLSRNDVDPEAAWLKYKAEVEKVNKEFGTQIMRGYMTERGRVYLQYGPPDQRVLMYNEPSSYPYEIWQYYTIRGNTTSPGASNQPNNTTQSNKRFVFANFDLVTNNFVLLHSDARGEVRDDRWQTRLVKRDSQYRDLDKNRTDPQYGGHSNDIFINPH